VLTPVGSTVSSVCALRSFIPANVDGDGSVLTSFDRPSFLSFVRFDLPNKHGRASQWTCCITALRSEAILLSAAGGLCEIILAYFGADALVRIITSGRPIIGMPSNIEIGVHPDVRVLLFTGAVAVLTGVLLRHWRSWRVRTCRVSCGLWLFLPWYVRDSAILVDVNSRIRVEL
jgi:hypothetical protein